MLPLSSCSSRLAAFSTSSASYPGFHAAYTTFVNCVGQGCGTAATSPLWSVRVNTQTHRAAPMEALPPHSPRHPLHHPHPRPHQTQLPHLHRRARKALKPEIFSHSGNSPEVDVMVSFFFSCLMLVQQRLWSICWIPEMFAAIWLLSSQSLQSLS